MVDFIDKSGYNLFVPLWLHAKLASSFFFFVARLDVGAHKSVEFCFPSK